MNTFELQYNKALKGRKITARGNALGLNVIIDFFVPRSETVQGDEIAWGKTEELYLKCNTLKKFRVQKRSKK